MTRQVLRAGLDRDVHAARVRRKEQRRRPGVVHHDADVAGVRRRCDRRDVLHLETLRPRSFDDDRAGLGRKKVRDALADLGIVVAGRDPEARQDLVGRSGASVHRRSR